MARTTKPASRSKVTAAAPTVTRPQILDRKVIADAGTYAVNKAEIDRLTAENEALKVTLLQAMGPHESVITGNRVLTRSTHAGTPATENVVITKAMIGQIIPGKKGRKGYTTLTVQ
ncbi:hypothetical protein HB662_02155 [Roseomonas frigidaquae]|uniref:Uncharacterized protein n=1 Tax=Falsiroseomonas frigidaquae TaxID=487318 RepID=A0ABX1ESM6_9PROT|nr:hypothetical protein [Falsiroseomonas frigidaquae]NKE43562.1 hypothetical protein [Falsiroseomonas frigidaquae]